MLVFYSRRSKGDEIVTEEVTRLDTTTGKFTGTEVKGTKYLLQYMKVDPTDREQILRRLSSGSYFFVVEAPEGDEK